MGLCGRVARVALKCKELQGLARIWETRTQPGREPEESASWFGVADWGCNQLRGLGLNRK